MSTPNTKKGVNKKTPKGTPLKSELMKMVSELKLEKAKLSEELSDVKNTLKQIRGRKLELENEVKSLYQSHETLKEDYTALKQANAILIREKSEVVSEMKTERARVDNIGKIIADMNGKSDVDFVSPKLFKFKRNFRTVEAVVKVITAESK